MLPLVVLGFALFAIVTLRRPAVGGSQNANALAPRGLTLPSSVPAFNARSVEGHRVLAFSKPAQRILLHNFDAQKWVVQSIEGPGVYRIGPGSPQSVKASALVKQGALVGHVYMATAPEHDGAGTLVAIAPPGSTPLGTSQLPVANLPYGDPTPAVNAIEGGSNLLVLFASFAEILV
jgi:hypothetical protein